MGHEAENSWDIVARDLENANTDEKFWWHATAPSLGRLLASCSYTKAHQLSHLQWYRKFILPALGPRPISGFEPRFQASPVFDGSAVEHSINWKEASEELTVRFTMEAIGYEAGTESDPFNQEETRLLLERMAKEMPESGLHLKTFNSFVEDLFLPPDSAGELLPKLREAGTPLSQAWLAFDLHRGNIMAKVYFMPILKWIRTGVSTNELVYAAARKCNSDYGSFDAPIAVLDDYIKAFHTNGRDPNQAPVIEMVAVDCIDLPRSRIKMYLRTACNTLDRVKDQYTLGGRLDGDVVKEGLQALSELWPILFRLEGTKAEVEHREVFPTGSYCGCAIEMKAGQARPETKIHIPVRKIDGTDDQLAQSLSEWFKKRGHGKFAARYRQDLASAFPDHDILNRSGTHTFVSFAYTRKTGVYMTMYYSTKILEKVTAQQTSDLWQGYDNLWRTSNRQ